MDNQAVWSRNSQVLETELGTDISLYDPAEEQVTVLNATASDIWRLIDGSTTVSEVSDLLAKAYGTDVTRVKADVQSTLSLLAEQHLAERIG